MLQKWYDMKMIKALSKVDKNDVALVGGKAALLGEMQKANFPVPAGFVIQTGTFKTFLATEALDDKITKMLSALDVSNPEDLRKISENIQALMAAPEMPDEIVREIRWHFSALNASFVAVRSSATAEDQHDTSWAGQLETYLNITEADLMPGVRQCWASLFTPAAIAYRVEKKLLETPILVAVIVQEMIQSEAAGIAFSINPVTGGRNHVIIEAGFGLGEAVVSGQITPDCYVIEKSSRSILDKQLNRQTQWLVKSGASGNRWQPLPPDKRGQYILKDTAISELAEMIQKLEAYFGYPVDVEWAWKNGQIFILQSRPITTL